LIVDNDHVLAKIDREDFVNRLPAEHRRTAQIRAVRWEATRSLACDHDLADVVDIAGELGLVAVAGRAP
jgi:hypothetical protein